MVILGHWRFIVSKLPNHNRFIKEIDPGFNFEFSTTDTTYIYGSLAFKGPDSI